MKIRHLPKDPGSNLYAIGDVHGCIQQLMQALDWCASDAASAGRKGIVILLGDYIDRGPRSREVIELLMHGPHDEHMQWVPILGNHDDLLVKTWSNPYFAGASSWWAHGGQQTLMSYGWSPTDAIPDHLDEWIPEEHIRFLISLPVMVTTEELIFVHAGLKPLVAIDEQDERDLLWIRGEFYRSAFDFGRPVVHGHTPSDENPKDHGTRIALDSGCFYSGKLAAAVFEPGNPKPRFHTSSAPVSSISGSNNEGFTKLKC